MQGNQPPIRHSKAKTKYLPNRSHYSSSEIFALKRLVKLAIWNMPVAYLAILINGSPRPCTAGLEKLSALHDSASRWRQTHRMNIQAAATHLVSCTNRLIELFAHCDLSNNLISIQIPLTPQPTIKGRFWQLHGAGWPVVNIKTPVRPNHSLARNFPLGEVGDTVYFEKAAYSATTIPSKPRAPQTTTSYEEAQKPMPLVIQSIHIELFYQQTTLRRDQHWTWVIKLRLQMNDE